MDAFPVDIEGPERMSILGLLMQGTLENSLRDSGNIGRARRLSGVVAVRAGKMAVALCFQGDRLVISSEIPERPAAGVSGGMSDLLGVVVGEGMVWPVLSGRVRISGNPFMLLKMLPLIRLK